MKKIKLFGLIAISMLAFASCDLVEDVKDAIDEIQDDQDPAYTESENGLEISVSYKRSGIGIYHIAQFAVNGGDTICTSFVTKTTYFTEALAKEAYDHAIKDLDEKEKERFTLDGKVLTISHPQNIGEKIAGIRFGLKAIYEGYKKGGEIINEIEIPTDGDGDGDGDGGDGDGGSGSSALISYEEFLDDSENLRIAASYSNPPLGQSIIASFIIEPASSDTICSDYSIIDFYSTEAEAEAVYNRLTEGMSDLEKNENGYLLQRNAVHSKNVNMESWSIMQIRSTLKGKVQMWELGIFD